jgi:hypothetical protein
VWQGSSENSGPQQVADPLWERLKALVRTVLAALQPPLQQHAGRAPTLHAPLRAACAIVARLHPAQERFGPC